MGKSILEIKGIESKILDVDVTPEDERREKSYSEKLSRYDKYTKVLDGITGHYARMKNQVKVQIEYIIALADEFANNYVGTKKKIVNRAFTKEEKEELRSLYKNFSVKDVKQINALDNKIHHDIVAMNTWITYKIEDEKKIAPDIDFKTLVHYGLTSADITTNAQSLIIEDILKKAYLPTIIELQELLINLAEKNPNIVMAARTHKQYAEHTLFEKKVANIVYSLDKLLEKYMEKNNEPFKLPGKLGGAIGNNVEILGAYPNYNWINFQKKFVEEKLGLEYELMTDQDHDNLKILELFDIITLTNKRLIKFLSDFRSYCGRSLFYKKTKSSESGSSIMSQKVNPWRIEGAETNLENAINNLEGFSSLTVYAEEGDLKRSREKREIGDVFAHEIIGLRSAIDGLKKYELNLTNIKKEVDNHPEMFAAVIQTILKREGVSDAYDIIKSVTMGKGVSSETYIKAIDQLYSENRINKKTKEEIVEILENPIKATGDAKYRSFLTLDKAKSTLKKIRKVWNIS